MEIERLYIINDVKELELLKSTLERIGFEKKCDLLKKK